MLQCFNFAKMFQWTQEAPKRPRARNSILCRSIYTHMYIHFKYIYIYICSIFGRKFGEDFYGWAINLAIGKPFAAHPLLGNFSNRWRSSSIASDIILIASDLFWSLAIYFDRLRWFKRFKTLIFLKHWNV